MELKIPELSLVVLVGVTGSGKSTFAKKHFKATEILNSDTCRGIVSNDDNDQTATADAFALLHYIASIRLKKGLLTVIDATNVHADARKGLIALAKKFHFLPVAIVLDLPDRILKERTEKRVDRNFGDHVIPLQRAQLRKSLKFLKKEGFRHVHVLSGEEEINAIVEIVRDPLSSNLKNEKGQFDIIGDIHGCYDELLTLLKKLGYQIADCTEDEKNFGVKVMAPSDKRLLFLGDLVDRGPKSPEVLKLVMSAVNDGIAFCVPGNHDVKLKKKLEGANVQTKHGLAETLEQLKKENARFSEIVKKFFESMPSHYVMDEGKLVIAHAGLKEEMHGRGSGAVRSFCMYGETNGETDEFGMPVRFNWASEYKGKATVVYGHTPVPIPQWLNNTLCIDTGCVFGGNLTALRYPEREIVSVPALKTYFEPSRPLNYNPLTGLTYQQEYDDLLDLEDVLGKRIISTHLMNNITIREDNAIAALESMSRFAVDPKWLIYLPPTMSPCETSQLEGLLEHPKEVFKFYASQGIDKVICEEKHMGSRAIIIICKDRQAATTHFGVNEGIGICYTRTGRNFFNDATLESEFLQRINENISKANLWEQLETEWLCLDCEIMPWSAKAQMLLQNQYAAVGAAAKATLPDAIHVLQMAIDRGIKTDNLLQEYKSSNDRADKFVASYQKYCWNVSSVEDYAVAPFHILASQGRLHTGKDHAWHMEKIQVLCNADPQFMQETIYKIVHLNNEKEIEEATAWWNQLTSEGGEGMVVKPYNFINKKDRTLIQPALKCRGKEYLRLIYGPDYDSPQNLNRLRSRGLSGKRSLALREFALGIEAMERFVKKEPLRKVHECVFGVLALESEPIDPRL